MTVKQLLKRLERIKDSVDTDFMNRYAIEGVVNDMEVLIDDVDSFGVDEDDLRDISIDESVHSFNNPPKGNLK